MLPNFIIIGAMKAGTSSLYDYLYCHPEIGMSTIKETDFFIQTRNWTRCLEWYESLFTKKTTIQGEASPNYTKSHLFPDVPKRIYTTLPDVKLIYILRNPIDRILSHYRHNVAHGRERRPIEEALTPPDNNYLLTSKYFFQITGFLEYFPQERILIIRSIDLSERRLETLSSVFEFLGVDKGFTSPDFFKESHRGNDKKMAAPIEEYVHNSRMRKLLAPFVPRHFKTCRPVPKPILAPDLKASIQNYLRNDIIKLSCLTGFSFDELNNA